VQRNGAGAERDAPASSGGDGAPIVRVRGVSKAFPGVQALDRVDLTVAPGEVHALTGENGSGKSTLAKIVAGVVQPDGGTIEVDGRPRAIPNPAAALRQGIVLISQELTLAPTLSVAENVYAGRLPRTRLGTIDWRAVHRDARAVLDDLGVHVDTRRAVGELSVELQQEIEIARAFSTPARILILDEATSSLSEAATARLLELVRRKSAEGVAVLMITHRMAELYSCASIATVLRDGRLVDSVPLPATPEPELVRLMVGRELGDYFGKRRIAKGEVVLELDRLASADGRLKPTSLRLHRGEILGIAGLVGSGKAELGQALGGAIPSTGTVKVAGRVVSTADPRAALAGGIGFVPDDRKRAALLPTRSVAENFSIAWGRDIARAGVIDVRDERRRVREAIDRYGVVIRCCGEAVTTP
jgi:ABC-type sugar transport system ATPase subunit